MPHTELPIDGDIVTLLGAMSPAIVLPSGFDIDSEIASAVEDWEERTHYRPFFQTSNTPIAKQFDPPGPSTTGIGRGGGYGMALGGGLLSLTSVYSGVNSANGNLGTLLVLGQDFWLWPANAQADPTRLKPYTALDFATPRGGLPQSIVITGVWGYCQTEVADGAWKAIRDMAAANCLQTLIESQKTMQSSWSEGEWRESYDPAMLNSVGAMLNSRAAKTLSRYRLLDF